MTLSDRSHADSQFRGRKAHGLKHLLTAGLVLTGVGLAGCANSNNGADNVNDGSAQVLPAGSFVAEWNAPLRLNGARPANIAALGDHIVVTDSDNRAYALTASGGTLTFARPIVDEDERLQPPVLISRTDADDLIVFVSGANVFSLTTTGQTMPPVSLKFAVTSAPAEANGMLYAGVAASGAAGQVGAIDPKRPYSNIQWRRVVFGPVLAKPVVFDGVVFVPTGIVSGTDRGRVYAISAEERSAVWTTALGENYFETFAGNTVGLVADDYGVYVASDDTQLYVLDRNSGALRWRFYAGAALETPPAVTSDRVYQSVEGRGLVALAKVADEVVREPAWVAQSGKKFIAADDRYVYALGTDGRLLSLDAATGAVKFASDRSDFVDAVVNTQDATIYAITGGGEVVKARSNLKPGGTGQKL